MRDVKSVSTCLAVPLQRGRGAFSGRTAFHNLVLGWLFADTFFPGPKVGVASQSVSFQITRRTVRVA